MEPSSSKEDGNGQFLVDALIKGVSSLESEQSLLALLFDQMPVSLGPLFSPFIVYAIHRRYGWSEMASNTNASSPVASAAPSGDGLVNEAHKRDINERLDSFLSQILKLPSSLDVLQALLSCTQEASRKPVVREQTFKLAFEYIRTQVAFMYPSSASTALSQPSSPHPSSAYSSSSSDAAAPLTKEDDAETFELKKQVVQKLILSGLTDVWSVVRKHCSGRLSLFIDAFDLHLVESIFKSLSNIINDEESSWQSVEGAVLGLTAIIRKFQWELASPMFAPHPASSIDFNSVSSSSSLSSAASSSIFSDSSAAPAASEPSPQPSTLYLLRFGPFSLSRLPDFVTHSVRAILFRALAHSQLSVRDSATRAFRAFLSRSGFTETSSVFSEVLSRLKQHNSNSPPSHWMAAHEAEGLISLAAILVKILPPPYILSHWTDFFEAIEPFLAHPASTVRQITSTIFQQLVAKDTESSLPLVRRVIDGLVFAWSSEETPSEQQQRWEWREGRMLAYELVLGFLLSQHASRAYSLPVPSSTRRNSPMANIIASSASAASAAASARPNASAQQSQQQSPLLLHTGSEFLSHSQSQVISTTPSRARVRLSPGSLRPALLSSPIISSGFSASVPMPFSPFPSPSIAGGDASTPFRFSSFSQFASESSDLIDLSSILDRMISLDKSSEPWFASSLHRIVLQTKECFSSNRWELRRIAGQVLPLISETTVLIDPLFLAQYWNDSLVQRESSTFCFACQSLKHALLRSIELQSLLNSSNESVISARDQIETFSQNVKNSVVAVHPYLVDLFISSPAPSKRMQLASIETLVISISHSVLSIEDDTEHGRLIDLLLQRIHALISSSDARSSSSSSSSSFSPTPERSSSSIFIPSASASSAATRSNQSLRDALVDSLSKHLPLFVKKCRLDQMYSLLPFLLDSLVPDGEIKSQFCVLESIANIFDLPLLGLQSLQHVPASSSASVAAVSSGLLLTKPQATRHLFPDSIAGMASAAAPAAPDPILLSPSHASSVLSSSSSFSSVDSALSSNLPSASASVSVSPSRHSSSSVSPATSPLLSASQRQPSALAIRRLLSSTSFSELQISNAAVSSSTSLRKDVDSRNPLLIDDDEVSDINSESDLPSSSSHLDSLYQFRFGAVLHATATECSHNAAASAAASASASSSSSSLASSASNSPPLSSSPPAASSLVSNVFSSSFSSSPVLSSSPCLHLNLPPMIPPPSLSSLGTSSIQPALDLCASKLAVLIKNKSLETSLLRAALDVLRRVCVIAGDSRYLSTILASTNARFKAEYVDHPQASALISATAEAESKPDSVQFFQIYSNDLPLELDATEDVASDSDADFDENDDDEDDDSDWDDWDDDVENTDKALIEFGAFLTRLDHDSQQLRTTLAAAAAASQMRASLGVMMRVASDPRQPALSAKDSPRRRSTFVASCEEQVEWIKSKSRELQAKSDDAWK